ncbi:glutaredoxin family protein [Cellulomonas sp. HD19AZ1]|nr:glutaredoxin family protein [Cellulomonas sp. HD19AZ1]
MGATERQEQQGSAAHDHGGATIYTTPGCVQCTATQRAMTAAEVPYRVVDVTQDRAAGDFVRGLGYTSAPVVVTERNVPGLVSGNHWSGYRPDVIRAYAAARAVDVPSERTAAPSVDLAARARSLDREPAVSRPGFDDPPTARVPARQVGQ